MMTAFPPDTPASRPGSKKIKAKILRRVLILIVLITLFISIDLGFIFLQFSSLDGLADAIDISGSERMRTILLGFYGNSYYQALTIEKFRELSRTEEIKENMEKEIKTYERFMNGLVDGDPELGLVPTTDEAIIKLIGAWKAGWKPFKGALIGLRQSSLSAAQMEDFVHELSAAKAVALKDLVHKIVVAYAEKSNQILARIKLLQVSMIGGVIIAGIIMLIVVGISLRPIRRLILVIEALHDKDLTVRTELKSGNEIGQLGRAIDSVFRTFDSVIGEIASASRTMERANEDLVSAVAESGAATREMVASIGSIHNSLENQKRVVQSTLTAVEEIKNIIADIGNHVSGQSSAVAESSASVEEMTASINSVGQSTEALKSIGKELEEIAHQGGEKIKAAVQAILDVQESYARIEEATGGITRIAATTNLLSMNASIEAAQAGAAGKGFAVVAEEIGNLAADSAAEARTIKENVQETLKRIEHGTRLSEEAGRAFDEIMTNINKTVGIIMEIANAMNEQGAGAGEINASMEHLVRLSGQISTAVAEETEGSRKVMEGIEQLDRLAREILDASTEQKTGGEEILKALEMLQEVARKNRETVNVLNNKISEFKVS